MVRTFYIEEKDREVINEFVEIHKAKADEQYQRRRFWCSIPKYYLGYVLCRKK